ncbi:MAG: methyltransferase domain-containing protein [Deltaproteobacteria bacterium]|nr:methyltransferase domain-containing protein [Deltaproteobacteria bacterium]
MTKPPVPTRLNLGCGQFARPGFLNVDIIPEAHADVFMDLNDPASYAALPENHFEMIVADHLLEHLNDVFGVMRALNRLTRPGGIIEIRVPHFSRGMTHPQHTHCFDVSFPEYFKPSFKGYIGVELDLVRMRLDYMVRFDLKAPFASRRQIRVLETVNRIVSGLANAQPYACSRFWCQLVGGFEQVEFIFKKPQRA